jgi:hypothetical protein
MLERVSIHQPGNGQAAIALILVLLLLVPLGYSLVVRVIPEGADGSEPFLERPDPEHESCVRDTVYMRKHHWELLRGVREEVVRYGIRGEILLSNCQECHKSREQFCNKCHDAVSLTPDCFDCHHYP